MTSLFRSRPAPISTVPLDPEPKPIPPGHDDDDDSLSPGRPRGANLMDLPPEIHLLISKELIYPDALSLKHTSRYFYSLINTGVSLKVAWLMERRMLHLDCPNDRKCNLRTDLEFCRGSVTSVALIPGLFLHLSIRTPNNPKVGLVMLTYLSVFSCGGVVNISSVNLVLDWGVWSITRPSAPIERTGGRAR